jgi:chemosensory pili system protein ChpA (sensor histidine kinase/response regulator)
MDAISDFDLGPLTWVKGEIDNALDTARRQLTGWDGGEVSPLRTAATHLHQVYGALQIVDLRGVSLVCEACERLLAAMESTPALRDGASARVILDAIEVIRAYLDTLMAGGAHTELVLAPTLEALQARIGEPAPAPSELFHPDIDIRAPRLTQEPALDETHRRRLLHQARRDYQRGLALWLTGRDPVTGLRAMRAALGQVEQSAPGTAQYTFWWAASGLLEALAAGRIEADLWVKRLLGRLDLQLKRLMGGSRQLAERLLRDILYYQADLPAAEGRAAEVGSLFQLRRYLPEDRPRAEATGLAPIIKTLWDTLEQAKDFWLRHASGKADAHIGLRQTLTDARARAEQLGQPALLHLVQGLAEVGVVAGAGARDNETLDLEFAATLLFAQNALDHFETLGTEFATQSKAQVERLRASLNPEPLGEIPPSLPLMDEFSRQAQEKLLLAQVTHEIQANLRQVETILDAFFRNREERKALPLVPGLMNQVLGALNMLQLDVAADLVRLGMERIAVLSEPEREITQEELDWIADAVSSLGLYIDALSHGRDDQAGLRALLAGPGQRASDEASVEETVREQAAELKGKIEQWATGADTDTEALRQDLARIAQDAELVGDGALQEQADTALRMIATDAPASEVRSVFQVEHPAPAESVATMSVRSDATEHPDIDAELLGIYITEAGEVLASVRDHLGTLRRIPTDHEAFTAIRRGFHTLKGSGRMVGLTAPAEVAWEVEQTLNLWLREAHAPTEPLLAFIGEAAESFSGWVDQLAAQGHAQVEADALVTQARVLRGEQEVEPPATVVATVAPATSETPVEPAANDALDEGLVEIGAHALPAPLYEIFVVEARQRLDELESHWRELEHAPGDAQWEGFARAAHTLAGICRTTGFTPIALAAHDLETWANAWSTANASIAQTGDAPIEYIAGLRRMYQGILDGRFPTTEDAPVPLPPVPEAWQEAALETFDQVAPPTAVEAGPSEAMPVPEAVSSPSPSPRPSPRPRPSRPSWLTNWMASCCQFSSPRPRNYCPASARACALGAPRRPMARPVWPCNAPCTPSRAARAWPAPWSLAMPVTASRPASSSWAPKIPAWRGWNRSSTTMITSPT